MTTSILPFVHAQGSWGEIGRQVGRMLAPAIERHVEAWTLQTVVSVIGDLTNRELHATKGAPCRAPYATYTLATCRTGALSVTVRDRYEPAVSD